MIPSPAPVAEETKLLANIHRTSKIWQVPLRGLLVVGTALLLTVVGRANTSPRAVVTAKASTDSVQVAQPFTVQWIVTVPDGSKVTFPATARKLGEFDVIETRDLFDVPAAIEQDTRTWTRSVTLESVTTGTFSIPELEIQVNAAGDPQTIRSKAISVAVVSVLENRGDPTQFRDIQSVFDVGVPAKSSSQWGWWTLGGAGGLAILAIALVALSYRKRWLTPKAWAMQELCVLEASVNAGIARSQESAAQLSNIARSFLSLQFGIPEQGRTSEELLSTALLTEHLNPDVFNRLRILFSLADNAKFAGLELSPSGVLSAINDSRLLIQEITDASESGRPSRQTPASSTSQRNAEPQENN